MAKIRVDLDDRDNLWSGTTAHELVRSLGGNDTLDGGGGNDSLYGGSGDNNLIGGLGDDSLLADKGNDTLLGGDGSDQLSGGGGNDLLDGGQGNDTLSCGPFFGALGDVTLFGGLGDDYITLAALDAGSAWVDAGDGNDAVSFVLGGAFDAVIDGGTGVDRLMLHAIGAAHIDAGLISTVSAPVSGQPACTFQNFEVFDLLLSDTDDWVKLGAGDDQVTDQGGAARIRTGAGDDALRITVDQAVRLDGGKGNDDLTVFIATATYALTVDRLTGAVHDSLGSSMSGFETLTVISRGQSSARISLGQGDDHFSASTLGQDTVLGYGGNDTIIGALTAHGGGGDDVLHAALTSSALSGGSGNDLLQVVRTGLGTVTLMGDDGQDRITMDKSSVLASGGADADTFVIGPTPGLIHRITDFTTASDVLEIADGRVSALTALSPGDLALGSANAASAQYILRSDTTAGQTYLYYDGDGTGAVAEILVVVFDGHTDVSATDIFLF